jgi:hypothetical protein
MRTSASSINRLRRENIMPTNVDQLVEQYITTHANAEAKRQAQAQAELDAAEGEFLELCRVWIGDLWDVLQPGTIKVSTDSSYGPRFFLPVSFEGVDGELFFAISSFFDRANLKFKGVKNIELKQEHDKAVPISDEEWGRVFAEVRTRIVEDRAAAERNAMAERERDIRGYQSNISYSSTIADANQYADEAEAKYPSVAWRALVEKRLAEFIQAENEVRRETEEREREEHEHAEHKRAMQEHAALVWFPFTVWKISFVARTSEIEDGEEPFYVDNAYCLEPEPDADGWWKTVYRGVVRFSKFPNMLRLDQIEITDPEMAEASNVCTGEWDYGVQVRIPPPGALHIEDTNVTIALVEA